MWDYKNPEGGGGFCILTKMNYSNNHGWGRAQLQGFPFRGSGKILFVGDSGTANRSMLTDLFRDDPDGSVRFFATLDAAVGACTADAGDVIYVAAGHTETITSTTTLTCDVAGIKVIGLGEGADRPTFTVGSAADASTSAVITVSAQTMFENIIFDFTGYTALTKGMNVTGDNVGFKNVKIITATASAQCARGIIFTSSDNLVIDGLESIGTADAGTTTALDLSACDNPRIVNSSIVGAFTTVVGGIALGGHGTVTNNTNVFIDNVFVSNLTGGSTVCISGTANYVPSIAITGQISNCRFKTRTDSSTTWIAMAWGRAIGIACNSSLGLYENYGVNVDGEAGKFVGVVSV